MYSKRLFKALVLSMLVAVGVMAVSASAAQAKWLIRVSGSSVSSANLVGTLNSANLLVENLGLDIECKFGGTITAKIETSGSSLSGSSTTTLTGCLVIGMEEACTVKTPGQSNKTIVFSGSGKGAMFGFQTYLELASEEFSIVAIEGALCPFSELEGTLNGTATLMFETWETEEQVHNIELNEKTLKFGEEGALLHSGVFPTKGITGSMEAAFGGWWAIKLVGL